MQPFGQNHLFLPTPRLRKFYTEYIDLRYNHLEDVMESVGKLTSKEAFILSFLTSHQRGYGLQMVKQSSGLLKRGSVYVMLNRMKQKGYVKSKQEPPTPDVKGPPRRYYVATAKGARALDSYNLLRSSTRGAWFTIN